jgi:glucosamine--fructose-6-phosphate aminotransferase (isomerizing)
MLLRISIGMLLFHFIRRLCSGNIVQCESTENLAGERSSLCLVRNNSNPLETSKMESGAATLREIHGQPEVWEQCLSALDKLDLEPLVGDRDPRTHEWLFVGCGTSYYLAQTAAATFTALVGVPARAVPASEILLFPKLVFPIEEAVIFPVLISRSGHTSVVLQVAEFLRQRGVEFLAVTCDGNELTRLSTRILRLPVTEESTVMTSSFTSMLMALQYVAARLARQDEFVDALHSLPAALAKLLPVYSPRIEEFAH